jgi:microcystin-dependent protein
MAEQFLGEIRVFGFNFPPTGWAQCNGQLLPIAQNTSLFSLLGTTYGGNGSTTFALPRRARPDRQREPPGAGADPLARIAIQGSSRPGPERPRQAPQLAGTSRRPGL